MKTYDTELKKAELAAIDLKIELEKRILGKICEAWKCGCGEIHVGKAEAVEVIIAGKEYPYQILYWYVWNVKMKEIGKSSYYYTNLSKFISINEIEEIFGSTFKNVDSKYIIG